MSNELPNILAKHKSHVGMLEAKDRKLCILTFAIKHHNDIAVRSGVNPEPGSIALLLDLRVMFLKYRDIIITSVAQ